MNPMLRNQLKEWEKKNMSHLVVKKRRKRKDKRSDDSLTFREIEELMGVRRATYVRAKGGAFRQR